MLFVKTQQNNSLFEQSTLDNHYLPSWIQVAIVLVFTISLLLMVASLRGDAKQVYEEQQQEKCKVKNHEWLRARTLHVRGLFPKDRRGDMLRNELNTLLKPVNGNVLDVVVIPDF